jgi:hypothetical protein
MTTVKPPSQNLCLRMAEYCFDNLRHEHSGWEWLFAYVMYDHYISEYWGA